MYDEGIDLYKVIRGDKFDAVDTVRVLGHVGTHCIHVPTLHHGVNGQGTPVSHSFAECERGNLTLGRVNGIERLG